ncbi:wsv040 [White spot syndrome virus]|uniref:Wsv040 n=3 Tax=White spot syndrome virus TaxID=342409 RepID=Q8VBC6_WSSVS|nr:wsv040 [Shrimp white spot syndrome virus]AFX59417.1 wsv040 [White spot syndrome virus]AAL33044.1 wsv040 [Shrimp white spot syndrome virus]AAL88965.1 WSSV097 [Shrimp white spot syndrome virus]AWQ60229.1 wsv040 [Shrimp white spot syndrome virus]AWQ60647.1 wsv040 [Shrimp white spot syndrome virus]
MPALALLASIASARFVRWAGDKFPFPPTPLKIISRCSSVRHVLINSRICFFLFSPMLSCSLMAASKVFSNVESSP